MKRRFVFFDSYYPAILPIVIYYLLRGYKLFIFDFEYNLKKSRILAWLINKKKINRIFIRPNSIPHGEAIDLTDKIFQSYINNPILKSIEQLYQSTEIALAFKKELLKEVFQTVYIEYYLRRNCHREEIRNNILITMRSQGFTNPGNNISIKNNLLDGYVTIPIWARLHKIVSNSIVVFFYYLFCLFCSLALGIFSVIKNPGSSENDKKSYKFLLSIESPFQTKFEGARGFDFLLDGEHINKENVLFLTSQNISNDWIHKKQSQGYKFLKWRSIFSLKEIYLSDVEHVEFRRALMVVGGLPHLRNTPMSFYRAYLKCIYVYLKTKKLVNTVEFVSYCYTNNESTSQIAMNIYLKSRGIKTWSYLIFLVGGYPRSKGYRDFKNTRNILWAYINPEHLIAMNDDVVSYFKLHKQNIEHYDVVGSIYSEMVRNSITDISREDFIISHFQVRDLDKTYKICAFFDTTFVDEEQAYANYEDAIAFYLDIDKLLQSRADLLVILKPSKDIGFYTAPRGQWASPEKGLKLATIINNLIIHPRIYYASDAGDIPVIMAVSDLIVTHCMSSTTAEALGARKKAIWYESGNKHTGLNYKDVPLLVNHGFDSLLETLHILLDSMNNSEYQVYLDKYIKGRIEKHMDGNALTRFREALISTANGNNDENMRLCSDCIPQKN